MDVVSAVLSSSLIALSILLGSIACLYSIYLLLHWDRLRFTIFPFLINLVVSCILIYVLAAPGKVVYILMATFGSAKSKSCILWLTLWRSINAETQINLAFMILWRAYFLLFRNAAPPSPVYTYMLVAVPWLIGVPYGVISSISWCLGGEDPPLWDPSQACQAWELLHNESLSGMKVRQMDRALFVVSVILQFFGYLAVITVVKHNQGIIAPYQVESETKKPEAGITKTVHFTRKTISINENPEGANRVGFPISRQESRTRVTCSTQKMSKHSDSRPIVRIHRSRSARDFSVNSQIPSPSWRKTRRLSEADISMIPGYIHEHLTNEGLAESCATDQDNATQDDGLHESFVKVWKNLEHPLKLSRGDSFDIEAATKEFCNERSGGENLVFDKESGENLFCKRSLSNYLSSNGTVSPNSFLRPSLQSGSFSIAPSSEDMSGYSLSTNFRRSIIAQNVPEAWITERATPSKKNITFHNVSTSTRSLEDVAMERHDTNNPQDLSEGILQQRGNNRLDQNIYTDTWRQMSSQATCSTTNFFCANTNPLTTLEKIKQWRTTSMDCSNTLTKDVDDPAFSEISLAPDMRDSISLENIRSVSQTTVQAMAATAEPLPSTTHDEEDNRSKKLPIRIGLIRPSSTLSTDHTAMGRKGHPIKENQTIWESSENFKTSQERQMSKNAGNNNTRQSVTCDVHVDQDPRVSKKVRVQESSATIAKMSQTDYRIAGNRTKKLIRMNSQNSIRVSQTTNNLGGMGQSKTEDIAEDVTENCAIYQDISQEHTSRHALESLLLRRILLRYISAFCIFLILHVPPICLENSLDTKEANGHSYAALLVLKSFPIIWYALAPVIYIIFIE